MFTSQIKQLNAARARVARLESSIASKRDRVLAGLPTSYGFSDLASFIAALEHAQGSGPARKGRKPGRPAKAKGDKLSRPRKTRKRARITDEIRAEVKKLLEEKKTGSAIAKAVGISLPSVQNIKKALGMVKARA